MRIIFDGNNTAMRCDYVSDLYNSQGKRTSATYGVLESIVTTVNIIRDNTDLEVNDIIFVWDFGKSERRKKLWPGYKANRHKELSDPIEEEQRKIRRNEQMYQMDYLHEKLPYFGVKSLRIRGEEADDLAYDLKCEYRAIDPNDDIVFVTSDEDYLQMVDEHCSVWNPKKKKLITYKNFKEIMGIPTHKFLEWKVMIGDKSDNIPGVNKVGEVTAAKYLNEYGTIDNLIKCVAESKKLQKSTILANFLTEDVQKTIDIAKQMIDFTYVDYSNIKPQLQRFILAEVHLDKKEVKSVIMTNQFTSIWSKLSSFLSIFNDLEYNKYGEL